MQSNSSGYMAKRLTLKKDMKLVYIRPGFEMYEGNILYIFIPAFKVEEMMPQVMADKKTLCVWMSDNHNCIVSSESQFHREDD